MLRILLYEDNTDLREGLTALLADAQGFELCGAFPDCDQVLEHIVALRPDVVIMDIEMPGIGGIEGVRRVKTNHPRTQVLVLTVFDEDDQVFDAVLAGADGYLLKDIPPARLLESLQEVATGGVPMSPVIARKVLRMVSGRKPQQLTELNALSARETDVLRTLSKGFSYKMVASELDISIETVRTYIKRIYEKLHVNSATEAAAKWHRHKW